MQAYIQQLLEDIRAAHQQHEPEKAASSLMPWETNEERAVREMEEYFAEVERFIHEDPPYNLSYYCGLLQEQFPPAEGLNDEQVAAVVGAYVEMLLSWNIDTDIPGELPHRTAYTLLISLLSEHFHIDKWGMSTWTFCNCEPSGCVYGEHCICKDYEWVKDLPEGDEDEIKAELRERERLRRRWDDDYFRPLSGDGGLPY